jgi:adenylate cyclase
MVQTDDRLNHRATRKTPLREFFALTDGTAKPAMSMAADSTTALLGGREGGGGVLFPTSADGEVRMRREIERKFLVQNDHWRRLGAVGTRYVQGYLANNERCSVRVRVAGENAWLNIKSAHLEVSRIEFDYVVPAAEAREILACLCERPLIEKTRYRVLHAGREWEIDVFEGDNEGLVIAELELEAVDESFEKPDWVGEDVSHDPRYYNVHLVKHPYKDW